MTEPETMLTALRDWAVNDFIALVPRYDARGGRYWHRYDTRDQIERRGNNGNYNDLPFVRIAEERPGEYQIIPRPSERHREVAIRVARAIEWLNEELRALRVIRTKIDWTVVASWDARQYSRLPTCLGDDIARLLDERLRAAQIASLKAYAAHATDGAKNSMVLGLVSLGHSEESARLFLSENKRGCTCGSHPLTPSQREAALLMARLKEERP